MKYYIHIATNKAGNKFVTSHTTDYATAENMYGFGGFSSVNADSPADIERAAKDQGLLSHCVNATSEFAEFNTKLLATYKRNPADAYWMIECNADLMDHLENCGLSDTAYCRALAANARLEAQGK